MCKSSHPQIKSLSLSLCLQAWCVLLCCSVLCVHAAHKRARTDLPKLLSCTYQLLMWRSTFVCVHIGVDDCTPINPSTTKHCLSNCTSLSLLTTVKKRIKRWWHIVPFSWLISGRWLGRTRADEPWCLHVSDNKNSLLLPPLNLLSGCHGSNRGGEWGASRDCKWESIPLSNLCHFSPPVHPPVSSLFSPASNSFSALGQFDYVHFVSWRCLEHFFFIFNTHLHSSSFISSLLLFLCLTAQRWLMLVVLGSFQVPQVQLECTAKPLMEVDTTTTITIKMYKQRPLSNMSD